MGREAEHRAEGYLTGLGWAVVARSTRSRGGEIDLVMDDGGTVVFVEVKARSRGGFGGPEGAVGPLKRRRVARAALAFLARRGWLGRPARFDVVAIEGAALRHIRGAFDEWTRR